MTTSGGCPSPRSAGDCAQRVTSSASSRPPLEPVESPAAGRALGRDPPVAACAKAISSSSISPSANDARQDRGAAARDTSRKLVAREPAGAPGRQVEGRGRERERIARRRKASTSVPSISAPMSVGRNGAEAGMVKTRAGDPAIAESCMVSRGRAETGRKIMLKRQRSCCWSGAAGADSSHRAGDDRVFGRLDRLRACRRASTRRRARSPYSRPASIARSNKRRHRGWPAGTPAKKAGVRIAAPA